MASQQDAVAWYYANVIGKYNTYSHGPGGLGGRFNPTGSGTISTDCSGSTWAAYKEACGVSIGMDCGTLASSSGMWVDGPSNDIHTPNTSILAPGDLLLFRGSTPGRPYGSSHVEMYLGDGLCAGCGSTKLVKPGNCTSPYWTKKYIGAKRILQDGAVVGGGAPGDFDASAYAYGGGGMMDTSGLTSEALLAKCPENIAFKGMWMRYQLQMGMKSEAIRSLVQTINPAFGDCNGCAGTFDLSGNMAGGSHPVPPGFPSDQVITLYLCNGEGHVTLKWSDSERGAPNGSGVCGGFDLPGGVHSEPIPTACGLTIQEALGGHNWNEVQYGPSRGAIGSERGRGYVAYLSKRPSWYGESDIKPLPSYWQKLIPYYRDRLIEAWNTPCIQGANADLATKLCVCHWMNWFQGGGYRRHGNKPFEQVLRAVQSCWVWDGHPKWVKAVNNDPSLWRP